MNLFETVKSAVTMKQAAEHYGCKVNRGNMICCPFHNDRHPSMKLNRDYFYCFGCGAHGDVINLGIGLPTLVANYVPEDIRAGIAAHGIRNGVLLTPDRHIWPGDEVLVRKVASSG